MIHWLTVDKNPSNPQQPIHSLRLAPVRQLKKTKERTDDPCPGADAKILSQPVPGEKHTECLWFHKQDSRNGLV